MRLLSERNDQLLCRCSVVVVLLICSGCRPSYQRDTAPVRGRVTVDGQPVTSGYVIATPNSGRMAKGIIQADGSFVMGTYQADDGVQLGRHSVVVHPVPADEISAKSRAPAGPKIPERYGIASKSNLEIEVTEEGNDDWLIDLRSQ